MIVTFKTHAGLTSDVTAGYINFLRCVTAIMTAPAGTTSLTVNPYTANNTINTGWNCIVSIDSNEEAGGWITSSSHNVPSSGNNVPGAYATLTAAAAYFYKADFYKETTGKTTEPFYKMCFHSYNDFVGSANWGYTNGEATTVHTGRTNITSSAAANMLITYGCSSTSDWTDTSFPPSGGVVGNMFNQSAQTTSYTMNGDTFSAQQNTGPGLSYRDASVQYKMAVGADYCIIWEEHISSTWSTGPFHTTVTGAGTTYWNNARYGSMFYMGTRETQPWENTRNDNPPWVAWNILINNFATGSLTVPWAPDSVCAYMATLNNVGNAATPLRRYAQNVRIVPYFNGGNSSLTTATGAGAGNVEATRMGIDRPIFITRNWGITQAAAVLNYANNPNTDSILYPPVVDPVTGTLVPGAYPITIKSSANGQWNAGGKCKGVYKSLGMPWANMQQYWQASNQTFEIDGETYIPVVIYEDMWLVRVA